MDDEVLGCGGILQKFDQPRVVFLTFAREDWRLGPDGKYVRYLGVDRIREMQKASSILGYQPVRFMYETHALDTVHVSALAKQFNLTGVEMLLIPGPSHDQDHQAVRRTVDVLMRPHNYAGSVLEYWTWGSPSPYDPQVVVPLTPDELAGKIKALQCYKTQLEPGGAFYPYSVDSAYSFMAGNGRMAHTNYAEVFTPVRLVPNKTTARFFDA
jgi:LmbE family N-acetylglucosaminyl deacetylase